MDNPPASPRSGQRAFLIHCLAILCRRGYSPVKLLLRECCSVYGCRCTRSARGNDQNRFEPEFLGDRLFVHDKLIPPMPEEQVSRKFMRHRLAIWYSKTLPKDHPLLK
ncbi:MAG: DUF5062 family protein [Gammaproteobacteria bacterium]